MFTWIVDIEKIFRTCSDALAGEETEFPSPDNPSKMRRSVENAEHVGKGTQMTM